MIIIFLLVALLYFTFSLGSGTQEIEQRKKTGDVEIELVASRNGEEITETGIKIHLFKHSVASPIRNPNRPVYPNKLVVLQEFW
jgi:hypothetical protein